MWTEDQCLRRAVVLGSALLYWTGVWAQARRVRKHTGRSPNVRPRGTKEILLWSGWMVVVLLWLALPFLARSDTPVPGLGLVTLLLRPLTLVSGVAMIFAGYAGTLWCYVAMGDAWRMGVNRAETTSLVTRGPYRLVRHPIYLFQIVILFGVALLLPTVLSLLTFGLHLLCVLVKASDEESYLLTAHSQTYSDYVASTGKLLPRRTRRKAG